MPDHEITMIEVPLLTPRERSTLYAGHDLWGAHGLGQKKLTCIQPWRRFVRYVDGRPVSHVGVIEPLAMVNGRERAVLGLGSIVTVEEVRGHGHARALIAHVLYTLLPVADYAVLFCLGHRTRFYLDTGWLPIETALVRQFDMSHPVLIAPPYYAFYKAQLAHDAVPLTTFDVRSLPW